MVYNHVIENIGKVIDRPLAMAKKTAQLPPE